MKKREQIVNDCFQAWIINDPVVFAESFETNAVYIESWGAAYGNLHEISLWFQDWNVHNKVLRWDIKEFWHVEDTCICEWYFECECSGVVHGFDGVSIIRFDGDKIVSLREFQSKIPNLYPYESKE